MAPSTRSSQKAGSTAASTSKRRTSKPRTSKPRTSKPRTSKPRTSKPRTSKRRTSKRCALNSQKTPSISIGLTKRIQLERDFYDGYPHDTIDKAERKEAIDNIANELNITPFQVQKNMGELSRRLGKVNLDEPVHELFGRYDSAPYDY